MFLGTGRLTDKNAAFRFSLYSALFISRPTTRFLSLSLSFVIWKMERGRLKQRLLHMFKIPSFGASCSSKTRKEDAIQEPIHVSRRFNWEEDGARSGGGRSLSLPHISPSPRLCRSREETALDSSHRSLDFCCGAKKTKEKPERITPPIKPQSPSYYHFKQMREELEREERRISSRKKKGKEKKRLLSNGYGFTSCSSEESFFSSDEGENGEDILFGSRSFSSDSSELYYLSRQKKKTSRRQRSLKREVASFDDGFRPVVAASSLSKEIEMERQKGWGPVREGFAVEKRSKDPYADFRSSMVEMIVEKQIFAARDLKGLLRSYLDLNDPRHHPVIAQVFSEIWEALFGC